MTIECYHDACPVHCTNEEPKDEGPCCFEDECRATPEQLLEYNHIRAINLKKAIRQADEKPCLPGGYTEEELELDNPHNQWMFSRGGCED